MSIYVERVPNGLYLRSLIEQIEEAMGDRADLVFKLREVVAETLGSDLNDALDVTFDIPLADSSLRVFDLRDVPAVRDILTPGVSDLRFRSDFSLASPAQVRDLIAQDPSLRDLLPPSAP